MPDAKHYVVRKARKRKVEPEAPVTLPASHFDGSLFSTVDPKTFYKVQYTVSTPQEVDRERNTCIFYSKSTGEKYHTSLEQCTCPAFSGQYACKHMVALALYLGYEVKSIDGSPYRYGESIRLTPNPYVPPTSPVLTTTQPSASAPCSASSPGPASAPPFPCEFDSLSAFADALTERSVRWLDKTAVGGCFWVESSDAGDAYLSKVRVSGKRLLRTSSSRHFNNRPAWFITP